MDKISYALGLSIGNNFRTSGIRNLRMEDFAKGIQDVFSNVPPQLGYDQAKELLNTYFAKLQEEKGEINEKAGNEFLRINKHKPGVTELPSGLQYQILKQGDGPKPTLSDKVQCHYHGTLINGVVFDSSIQRGEPAVFALTQVIAGWTEALQLMNVGSEWRLFIPPTLAYGPHPRGEHIEANSVLVFDLKLLSIVQ
ncbi:MAG: FKBP-type peptidyl-prolyl cis-trans isomerase [Tannerellaceae bacterium]|jgi:FKBP-type peptidyl-prolyl cis-trans isomerase FklB|nr:FKBP-type peptidyl-prolyl cis-trans isomerase [Tannerellaceae bacterium]